MSTWAPLVCENEYSSPEIVIPSSVNSLGELVFNKCKNLKKIEVANGNLGYKHLNGVLFDIDMKILISYPIGNQEITYEIPENVETIEKNAFENCYNLNTINFDVVDGIVQIDDYAFKNCESLLSFEIPQSAEKILMQ